MRYLFIAILNTISIFAIAQSDEEALDFELIVASHNDKVILRWAPVNERSWLKWKDVDVKIYRRPIDPSGNNQVLPLELIEENIAPWKEVEYENYANQTPREDSLVMLSGYLMHAAYETTRQELTMQNMVDRKEELSNRFSTALYTADMNSLAAEALGMRATDNNVNSKAYYTVIVTWNNGEQTNKTIYFDPINDKIPSAGMLRGKEMERHVTISWDQSFHKNHFTAYWIEKSKDGNNWDRLNSIPYVHAFDSSLPKSNDDYIYLDSVPNYNPHHYRIIGISPFGIESSPSESIVLQGRDRTPPSAPKIIDVKMMNSTSMTINWEQEDECDDLLGYVIKKDTYHDGGFEDETTIISKSSLSFEDYNPNYLSNNFYKVCAIDTAKNYACSLPTYGFINDTIPPNQPKGLVGIIDSNGIVNLSWDQNTDIDLAGYHVYLSNRKNGVFSKLTATVNKTNQFIDTLSLNTLTEEIYYSITAEDLRSNVSKFSNKIQLVKPDTIPPSAAVFKAFKNNQAGILLSWNPSSSRDAIKQSLWRTEEGEGKEKIKMADFDLNATTYIDSSIRVNVTYVYEIMTEDDSFNRSICPNPIKLKASNLINKPKIILKKTTEKGENKILYTIESLKDLDKVVIYKSTDNRPYSTYKIFNSKEQAFTFNQNEKASYKAIAITKQGIKSDASIIKIN